MIFYSLVDMGAYRTTSSVGRQRRSERGRKRKEYKSLESCYDRRLMKALALTVSRDLLG